MANSREQKKRVRSIITYSVVGVVIVALALYIVFRNRNQMNYKLPTIAKINASAIDDLVIQNGTAPVMELKKQDGSWLIEPQGYKADPTTVSSMLKDVANLQLADLVSMKGYYEQYQLDDQHKISVTAEGGGKVLRKVDIGKQAPTYNHTYVKISNNGSVYTAVGDLRYTFNQTRAAMRDKSVLTFDTNSIGSINVTYGGKSFVLSKSIPPPSTSSAASKGTSSSSGTSGTAASGKATLKPVWKAGNGAVWDTQKVTDLLNHLHSLQCTSFYTDKSPNLGNPQLVLGLNGPSQYKFWLYGKSDNGYSARSSGSPYAFYISQYDGDNILQAFKPATSK